MWCNLPKTRIAMLLLLIPLDKALHCSGKFLPSLPVSHSEIFHERKASSQNRMDEYIYIYFNSLTTLGLSWCQCVVLFPLHRLCRAKLWTPPSLIYSPSTFSATLYFKLVNGCSTLVLSQSNVADQHYYSSPFICQNWFASDARHSKLRLTLNPCTEAAMLWGHVTQSSACPQGLQPLHGALPWRRSASAWWGHGHDAAFGVWMINKL